MPQTGLRFFTVYGPWGRPDMAYYAFARAIMAGEPIPLYDGGRPKRDFTYIDDIVAGVLGAVDRAPAAASPRLLNIGNHRSESVGHLVALLEAALNRKASHPGRGKASGGCCGKLGGHRRYQRFDGLCAADDSGSGNSAFRGLVPGLSSASGMVKIDG